MKMQIISAISLATVEDGGVWLQQQSYRRQVAKHTNQKQFNHELQA